MQECELQQISRAWRCLVFVSTGAKCLWRRAVRRLRRLRQGVVHLAQLWQPELVTLLAERRR